MTTQPERRSNKRRGPDIWVKLIRWFGVSAWVLMVVVVILMDKARPQLATFFDRILNLDLRTTWDLKLLRSALLLMIVLFYLCVIGLVINAKRHRRKSDRYNRSLIGIGILAALGIVLCLLCGVW